MSFNGSGTFVINSAGQPVVANTVISATTFNALTADLANGLTTCITKDGQTTPTANIPMGGFKITNLATGTAATDAATVAQIQSNGAALVTVTGTDTLTGSLTPALVAYVTGAVYYFVAPAANTGAVTLNIDTLGAKNVTRDGTTALVAGDIVSGEMVAVVYDGTRFQLISPVNSFTNLNVSGTLTVAGTATLNGNVAIGDAAADTINFKSSGWTLTNNVSVIGTWADIGTITTADINGGTIDGTTIGGGTAAAGTFTTATATTGNITTVNATTVDSTNLEVTNLKAKDGTAAGSIADATGVVTLNSVVATTADINGGTIDATTIGGSSPAVGNFTTVSAASAVFTTATITTVNTTTLDLTNLEVTNIKAKDGTASMTIDDATGKVNATTVSAASMNAGVAAVTSLTATGASVASANVGTAVITNGTVTALTATGASIASMNAGVALLTTATVTNFTASGASIASANIGNLQFTAASIASINAGVAVITSLTATGASIASANVGTAVITAATVTGASIASMNAGVALLTTATVTNLTAAGASIASANVGTLALTRLDVAAVSVASANAVVAVITTGTVTNLTSTSASIASMNAGVALLTTATVTSLTATGASVASANVGTAVVTGLTVTGASIASVNAGVAVLSGNLTLNGGTANGVLYLNGSKVATSGTALVFDGTNLGIGTASPAAKFETFNSAVNAAFVPNTASTWRVAQIRNDGTGTAGSAAGIAFVGRTDVQPAGIAAIQSTTGGGNTSLSFMYVGSNTTTEGMRLDNSGNLGLGVTPSASWFASSKAIQIGISGAPYMGLVQQTTTTCDGYMLWGARLSGDRAFQYTTTGDPVCAYRQNAGTHNWFTAASGTAGNTISFTQAMTLDASGNLLVGGTSTAQLDGVFGQIIGSSTKSSAGIALETQYGAYMLYTDSDDSLIFYDSGDNAPRARITSAGNLLVGCTAVPSTSVAGFCATGTSSGNLSSSGASTSAYNHWLFLNGNGTVGSISTSGSATTYSTSSDRRLKDNIAPADSAGAVIDAIEVVKHDWKAGGHTRYGMIAQDLHMVAPEAVSVGDADDVEDFKNPWGVDYSKLVPMLVKELQSLRKRVAELEAK